MASLLARSAARRLLLTRPALVPSTAAAAFQRPWSILAARVPAATAWHHRSSPVTVSATRRFASTVPPTPTPAQNATGQQKPEPTRTAAKIPPVVTPDPSAAIQAAATKKKKTTVRRAGGAASQIQLDDAEMGLDAAVPTMTVFACCTAEAYDLSALRAALIHSPTFTALPDLALDVVYARALPATSSPPKAAATRLTEYGSSAPMTAADDDGGELFAFADGSFVAWGANAQALGARFLSEVVRKPTVGGGSRRRPVEIGASAEVEVEVMDYIEDPNEVTGLTGDTIQIGADPPPALSKLAFSHGLSRSVKIAVLEALLDRYLEPTRHVPALLAQGQKLKLSRTEILQQIGELLSVRALLNLAGGPNTESLLDTPEYYWSKPQLEEYYNKVCRWLDVKPRISVLNQKLDYAAEFAQVLRGHLSEQHSLKLEWFIIILIAIEVVFGLCEWGEKLGYLEFNTASHHVAVHGPNEPGPVAAGAHIGSNNHGGHCCSCQCAAHPATVSQEKV